MLIFVTNGAQILEISKILSIKNILYKVKIENYIYISGFISGASSKNELVGSATILEVSDTLTEVDSLLQNAINLIGTVGFTSANQAIPWCLNNKDSTWYRISQIDEVKKDIESVGHSPPVLALCLTHSNGIVELLMVHLPYEFGASELSELHSNGLRVLAAPPQNSNQLKTDMLSSAERKCLVWCARGKTSYEMGLILGLSEHTINHYLGRVQKKLDVSTRAQAVAAGIKNGVIALESLD